MSIITRISQNCQSPESRIQVFIKKYSVGRLLARCGAVKEKGVSVIAIFQYLLCLMFSDRSMYMQMRTNRFHESFSKNTVYRFLNSARIHWEHFTALLSERIVNTFLRPLTSDDRRDVFILDDSTFRKRGYKKTELVARVFDHVEMKYIKGFRMLTLGWSDGNTFVPITHRLLSSSNNANVLGVMKNLDKRSIAFRRRKEAREKATDVMMTMLKNARKIGHHAKYVLFDSWFSSPKTIIQINNECHLDTIAMLKKSAKINYLFEGKLKNIKQIYAACKKRRGRSKYLLSVDIEIVSTNDNGETFSIPARIVCVRNRSNRKDWLALICTDTELSEEEIIQTYGKRWDIEVFFKTCKDMLGLEGCHSLSYDAHTAYVSIVFVRYMLIALETRIDEDDRTGGQIFFLLCDELQDISFQNSLSLILQAVIDIVMEKYRLTEEMAEELMNEIFSHLPVRFREMLMPS
ncbi:MAG: transposase [Ruminococcus sp.]|nr:transposase [Ruminococcus sp.]